MPSKGKTASILPSSFVDSSLSELTAGDVIRKLHIDEAKRRRNAEDFNQSDVAIRFRSVPDGLIESLDGVSASCGMSRPVVTKCLSHHAMSWYQGMPQVKMLSSLYKAFLDNSDGFTDIARRVKRDDYEFYKSVDFDAPSSLRTAEFIASYFNELGKALGIPSYKLFLTGLCWSISTNVEGWTVNTVSKYLVPEVKNMQTYIGERILTLDYAEKVIKLRQGDPLTVAYVKSLTGEE